MRESKVNQFGGSWTEAKMEIVVNYAKAYLVIMNKQDWVKTLYFDGFAGSGIISANDKEIKGTALRILDIEEPKPFDTYYFVEKDKKNKDSLEAAIKGNYPHKKNNTHVVNKDCNTKLIDMANYLLKNKSYRALAFIDPFGMSVNWKSIEALKDLGIDLWILVPTGLGVNRLLKNDQKIPETWLIKLETFLGLSRETILSHFYSEKTIHTLFGSETKTNKELDAIEKIGGLYTERLRTVFKFVSESFIMRNSTNSIMYHFMMATNNKTALKLANEIIKPKYKI